MFNKGLIISLQLMFFLFCIGGMYLLYLSYDEVGESSVEIKKTPDETSFTVSSPFPGIIVFAMGAFGLISLLYRIPIRRVVQSNLDRHADDEEPTTYMMAILDTGARYGPVERVPILLWWLIGKRTLAIRSTDPKRG